MIITLNHFNFRFPKSTCPSLIVLRHWVGRKYLHTNIALLHLLLWVIWRDCSYQSCLPAQFEIHMGPEAAERELLNLCATSIVSVTPLSTRVDSLKFPFLWASCGPEGSGVTGLAGSTGPWGCRGPGFPDDPVRSSGSGSHVEPLTRVCFS